MYRVLCRTGHFHCCAVLFSICPPFVEHDWHFHCRIQVNLLESPNSALDAGKHVPANFPLSCPCEQRAVIHFQVAGCLSARQPR